MSTYPLLTKQLFNNNIGQIITWHAYGYRGNFPYKGTCKLIGWEQTKEPDYRGGKKVRPIIEHISGDELNYGWLEKEHSKATEEYITYSDNDRPVRIGAPFSIYNAIYDAPQIGCTRAKGNPMTIGVVVWDGQDITTEVRKRITAIEFNIELIK